MGASVCADAPFACLMEPVKAAIDADAANDSKVRNSIIKSLRVEHLLLVVLSVQSLSSPDNTFDDWKIPCAA